MVRRWDTVSQRLATVGYMATDLAPEGTRLTHRFADAVAWAASLHRDQARKGKPGVAYISHPIGVASLVLDDGGSEDEAIAALLHDVVEDCRISLEEIDHRFGPAVAAIVESTTDSLPGNTERGANDWSDRKRSYLEHLEQQDNPSALRVSAADKLYNVCDLVARCRDGRCRDAAALQRRGGRALLVLHGAR